MQDTHGPELSDDGIVSRRTYLKVAGVGVSALALSGSVATQSPFDGTNRSIPGRIPAEYFDEGGEGVAYHDTSSRNKDGAFRTDEAVDVGKAYDSSGKYMISLIKDGEWLEYTADVDASTYDIDVRVATDSSGGTLTASMDGTTLGSVDISNTGGWHDYTTVTIPDVSLDGGSSRVLRLDFSGSATFLYNLNWVEFVDVGGDSGGGGGDGTQSPYDGTKPALPARVQAERFDEGGESVAYHDTTSSNKGGDFRTDEAVDVESTKDSSGTYNVGWIDDGEWLEYTVDTDSGTYDVDLRVATANKGTLTVSLDGTTLGSVDVSDTGGWQSWQTETISDVSLDSGTDRTLRFDFSGSSNGGLFNVNWAEFVKTGDSGGGGNDGSQSPYEGTMRTVPGRVQAEYYDEGGEGVAYHDTSSQNKGGDFRTGEAVDVETASDASGTYNVGYIQDGEWLEYTLDVSAGTYDIDVRVATDSGGGTLTASMDGTTLGSVDVSNTGGWQDYTTLTIPDVSLDGGSGRVLRLEFSGSEKFLYNLNWVEFVDGGDSGGSSSQSPYDGTKPTLPARVQAERFDEGGEGVAYHDTTSSNKGGAFRTDEAVDIESTKDSSGEYNVGWTADGEWLEYTVDTDSGTYDLDLRVASDESGTLTVLLDGATLGSVDISNTGGWQSWQTRTISDVSIDSGTDRVLRLEWSGSSGSLVNVNWLEFGSASTDTGSSDAVTVRGETKTWHRTTLDLDGPSTSEGANQNPFLDQRFAVRFTKPSGETVTVPGFFAADGDAADTNASSGSVWRCHVSPDETGTWDYETVFQEGGGVAVDPGSGSANDSYDGLTGSFDVSGTDKSGEDFRARGLLEYTGDHYWQFAGSGERFVKNGANSPENFLGYDGFDGTPNASHSFSPHESDWRSGDPTWNGGNGKGIVGAVNYLADKGVNVHYFLPYTIDGGDGGDTYPWTGTGTKRRFDVSKLAQWEVLFGHMTRRGVGLHVQTQERENDTNINGGDLGTERKLYYRELVARFAHHPVVLWNLGEETTRSTSQLEADAAFIRSLDPYDHPIGVHNFTDEMNEVWEPLMGNSDFDYGPLQDDTNDYDAYGDIVEARRLSAGDGRPWVIGADELGDYRTGVPCDGSSNDGYDQPYVRKVSLWPSLLAGAGGCEWYFGYQTCGGDVSLEDYRTRDNWWDWTRYATEFFENNVPVAEMTPADGRLSGASGHLSASRDGSHYVVYLPSGGDATVDLDSGSYTLRWYNPRTGNFEGSTSLSGGSNTDLPSPPIAGDAVALIEK